VSATEANTPSEAAAAKAPANKIVADTVEAIIQHPNPVLDSLPYRYPTPADYVPDATHWEVANNGGYTNAQKAHVDKIRAISKAIGIKPETVDIRFTKDGSCIIALPISPPARPPIEVPTKFPVAKAAAVLSPQDRQKLQLQVNLGLRKPEDLPPEESAKSDKEIAVEKVKVAAFARYLRQIEAAKDCFANGGGVSLNGAGKVVFPLSGYQLANLGRRLQIAEQNYKDLALPDTLKK